MYARLSVLVILLTLFSSAPASAQGVIFGDVPGRRQADVHNPYSPRYLDFQPNGLARRTPIVPVSKPGGGHGHHHGHHHHHHGNFCRPGFGFGFTPVVGWFSSGTSLWVNSFNSFGNISAFSGPVYYDPYYGYFGGGYLPPVYVNYGAAFGPSSLDPLFDAPAPRMAARPQQPAGGAPADPDQAPADDIRDLNAHRAELAERFIEFGDKQFAAGQYNQAQLRYRKAVDIAPTQGLPHFRRGQAFIALGRWSQAADELYRGLELSPEWATSGFKLQGLYHGREADLAAHTEAVAAALAAQPGSRDLEFLLGWQLFFTGQQAEARVHLAQAAGLGVRDKLVKPLLAAEPAAAGPGRQVVRFEVPPPPVKKPAARMPGAPQPPRDEPPMDGPPPAAPPAQQPPVEVGNGIEI